MTNKIYPKFKEFLADGNSGGWRYTTADIRCILVDGADYTYSDAHDFLDDVPAGARVAVTASLTGKSAVNGVHLAADTTFPGGTGDPCEAIIVYCHDGGADSARRLIAYIDSGQSGLPITPNGVDITYAIHDTDGLFTL